MTALNLFGFIVLLIMMIFYMFENRSHWCILGFAVCCVLSSVYGFLQGAWPFGVIEAIWTVVSVKRWYHVQ